MFKKHEFYLKYYIIKKVMNELVILIHTPCSTRPNKIDFQSERLPVETDLRGQIIMQIKLFNKKLYREKVYSLLVTTLNHTTW